CWRERFDAGPVRHDVRAVEPCTQLSHAVADLLAAATNCALFKQGRSRLPERAGMDSLRHRSDVTAVVQLHDRFDAAAASGRADLRPAILALQLPRLLQRCREPQDLRRIERRVHSLRQLVPPGPSSKMMPSAFNSSRMRSAVAK